MVTQVCNPRTTPLRSVLRCVSVEIHPGQFSRWGLLPHAPCQPGASPLSALTRVPPQAVSGRAPPAVSSLWQNPRGVRRAMHPGQTTGDGTHAAQFSRWGLGRRSIPAEPRRFAPLIVAFRSEYTRASSPGGGSSLTRLVSRASPRPRRSPGFHHRLLPISTREPPWSRASKGCYHRMRKPNRPPERSSLRSPKRSNPSVCSPWARA